MSCNQKEIVIDKKNRKIPIENSQFSSYKFEVSVADFSLFVKENNYITTADSFKWSGVFSIKKNKWEIVEFANWEKPDGKNKASKNNPVTHISYYDAEAFCKSKGGRLPTANEWDALAGNTVIVGNVWQGPFPVLDEGKDGYKAKIAPIGQFKPNKLGLYDVFGNVWEWTSSQTAQGKYIIKGGSFLCDYDYCSGFIPEKFQTTDKDAGLNHLGFRCVFDK